MTSRIEWITEVLLATQQVKDFLVPIFEILGYQNVLLSRTSSFFFSSNDLCLGF